MGEEKEVTDIYPIGTRVIITGLLKSKHLNGKHGTIASNLDESDQYKIDLDTMLLRINAKRSNLNLEPKVSPHNEKDRAGCTKGVLVESHGRAISHLLDLVRFMIGNVFMNNSDIHDMRDIDRLRRQGGSHGLMRLNQFMGMGWTHWLDSGSFIVPSKKKGVYGHMVEYLKEQVPEHNPESVNDPTVQLMTKALDAVSAVGGWHIRVHGAFWVVGDVNEEESSGTYLIPDSNQNMVFKVLGIRNNLYTLVKNKNPDYRPLKMIVTMVPWYGRLVYDGVVVPATNGSMGQPIMANASLTAKLKQTVMEAEERGCVIERLAELELEDSESYLPDMNLLTINDGNSEKEEPTSIEKALLAKLAPHALLDSAVKSSRTTKTFWTMRRFGYTEEDNPDHIGIILNDGLPIGDFTCTKGLIPTSTDILNSLIQLCADSSTNGLVTLPSYLNIDERSCFLRIKCLFEKEDVFGNTEVLYYHPPSAEETAAATVCSSGGSRAVQGGRNGYGQAA